MATLVEEADCWHRASPCVAIWPYGGVRPWWRCLLPWMVHKTLIAVRGIWKTGHRGRAGSCRLQPCNPNHRNRVQWGPISPRGFEVQRNENVR